MILKKFFKLIIIIVIIILIPVGMDCLIFGNAIPSNIDNGQWAAFLGSYIGGIATLIAVYITIQDNNKRIREEKAENEIKNRERRRLAIMPYLDSRIVFYDHEIVVGENDRIFYLIDEEFRFTKYRLLESDRIEIKRNDATLSHAYLNYIVRNIGAGNAVDMSVYVNGVQERISLAKDEKVSLLFDIALNNEIINLCLKFDYWDVEHNGHYNKNEKITVKNKKGCLSIEPIEKEESILLN